MDFPSGPTIGQTFTFGTRTWTWNGSAWALSGSNVVPSTAGANLVYAGPASGGSAAPSFRSLVTADIANSLVTYAKIQDVTDARLLGRSAGSAGTAQEISIGANLTLSAGVLSASGGGGVSPGADGTYLTSAAAATAWQPAPTPDGLLDRLRNGQLSQELFTLVNGVNEFDLIYSGGTYYWAYDNKTETKLRSDSTIAGLSGASDSTPVANGRYPALYLDGTTWHLYVWIQASLVTRHYTASSFTGSYTLSDSWASNLADPDVKKNPYDGKYYAAYKNIAGGANTIGVQVSTSLSGAWSDLGSPFSVIGRATWHVTEEADPTVIFFNNRAFIAFAGWDGSLQRVGIVEVHPTTMKAVAPAVVVVEPLDTWQRRNANNKVFSPTFLSLADEPGRERLYYSQNPNAAFTSGWGYLEVAPPPPDGRKPQDAMRLNVATLFDAAAGILATAHGSPARTSAGLVASATPSGAYGVIAKQAIDDFTLIFECTPSALPAGGAYALLMRVSTQNSAVTPIAAMWIQGTGARIYAEVKNNAGSGNLVLTGATTTIAIGTRYRFVLRKYGTDVRLFVNGVQETSGTHSGSMTGLQEWAICNQKGITNGASQQFLGTVHSCAALGEAVQLSQC